MDPCTELREWSKKTCLDVLNSRAIGLIVRLKQGKDYRLKFIKGKKRNMFFFEILFLEVLYSDGKFVIEVKEPGCEFSKIRLNRCSTGLPLPVIFQ